MNTRNEQDSLGEVEVPADSYGGSFTTRAQANFQISGLRAPASFKRAFAWIKMAAAEVNADCGELDEAWAKAIVQAAEAFIKGHFDADYQLDVYQAGAGTPFNMNLNEILANKANELLGGEKGTYDPIHPNNHVNRAQSSNDTNPTAIRIAALLELKGLMEAGRALEAAFSAKAEDFAGMKKTGRTHLQDAVPITLGDEFGAYASALGHALDRIELAQKELHQLGIGGTATGSAINTPEGFSEKMCARLSELSGLELTPARNLFETTHSMAAFANLSSALKSLATELLRIGNDLRLLASGPKAGLAEIVLPEVEPGSSIMPGKVNPSVVECMSMICVQVMGLDHSIALAAQQGQLELNWFTPLIMWDLLHQIEILSTGMHAFRTHCVEGIVAQPERMLELLGQSTAMATALAPHLGYHKVAELVHEALDRGVAFPEVVPEEYQHLL